MRLSFAKIRHTINWYILWGIEVVSKSVFYVIPKKNNRVLFGAWFGHKYIDNTKYAYEYLLNDDKLDAIWFTREVSIYDRLKAEGKPVVLDKTIKGIWTQLRSRMFVSTVQMEEFNPFFVTRCIYLDLGHGHPIKDSGRITWDKRTKIHCKLQQFLVDYHVAYPGKLHGKMSHSNWNTPLPNIHLANFARNDYFFDKALQSKQVFPIPVGYSGKTIVYMPTHRNEGKQMMEMSNILDLPSINQICKDTDSVFIIKKHFYHRLEKEKLDEFDRIFDLTDAAIDPQDYLLKADILITDYSACYVDYLLLDRPLIFYQYDYEKFKIEERSMIIPFEDIDIAYKPKNKEDLNNALRYTINDADDIFREQRKVFMKNYFEHPYPHHGREDVKRLIHDLLSQK